MFGPFSCSRPLINAWHRQQAGVHPRQDAAHGADLRRHRHVNRDHRRALGHAIAFENAQAEFILPQLFGALLQLLRPGDHVAQAVEIVRIGETGIVGEEGRSAEQHRTVAIVDQLRHHAIVQRAGIENTSAPVSSGVSRPTVRPKSGTAAAPT